MITTHGVRVRQSQPDQPDLRTHREHCSADPRLLAAIGIGLGQQIRIRRSNTEFGLYTVSETKEEDDPTVVRMGLTGRRRLGTDGEFCAMPYPRAVADPGTSVEDAKRDSEYIEQLSDDGANSRLIAIAPHGGDIEPRTDDQAERVAASLAAHAASSWRAKGFKNGGDAFVTWHATSADLDARSFPALGTVISRGFADAVAFHGFTRSEILVGGDAPAALKKQIRDAIDCAIVGSGIDVVIACPGDEFGGDDPANVVNRLTASGRNGIQIEQSRKARDEHWAAVADAVASVYERRYSTVSTSRGHRRAVRHS